ncbi:MAG: hypothetical protein ACRDF0_02705 [Candidatus Limnocylindria bacterium]
MAVRQVLQRLAPDVEHGVGAHERVAHGGGLLGVQVLGLVAILGGGKVEVARYAEQLVGTDRRAGAATAVRHIGLDRAEVPPAMEDDRQLVAEGQPCDAQGDRGGCLPVEEGPPKKLVGVLAVVHSHLVIDMFTAFAQIATSTG